MCEFCTEHAEGKKWYLEMKHFAAELLHQRSPPETARFAGAANRMDYIKNGFATFVVPAHTGVPFAAEGGATTQEPLTQEEATRRAKIVHFGQVLPIEDVEQVVDLCSSIVRIPCGCRFLSTGKADKRYCFGLGADPTGMMGAYPDSAASMEVLSRDEAKRILREFDQEGLIHSIWTMITPYVGGLCNCDYDCLWYKSNIQTKASIGAFRAEYVCTVDPALCTGCRSCMKRCQFGAQFYSASSSRVFIDPHRCFGCGVCRAACAATAIKLIPRNEVPEAADLWVPVQQ
jgi:ferredoxin